MAGRPVVAVMLPFLTAIAAFAGCLEEPAPAATTMDDGHDHVHGAIPWGVFSMLGDKCEEGGFVALYPMRDGAKNTGGWELADIRAEVGNPMRDGVGRPLNGPAMGNWHQGYRCVSASVDGASQKEYIFGWIGNMIKPPAYDPGGADLHFVAAGFGFGNGTIADNMRMTTTAAISHAHEPTTTTWFVPSSAPRAAVYTVYSDVEKGVYSSYSSLHKFRELPERTIRLWWQVPADGSVAHASHDHDQALGADEPAVNKWHPVYWDIKSSGATQFTTPPVDSPEVACHTGAGANHGPQGGACQPTLTTVYQHKSIQIESGRIFEDVTLDKIWIH